MVSKLTRAIPEVEIYGCFGGSQQALRSLYDSIDAKRIEFEQDWVTQEELRSIESLKWMKVTHSGTQELGTVLRYYNELARKFLLEKRHQAAGYLLY